MRIVTKRNDSERLIDIKAVSQMLACSQRHVFRLIATDRIPKPIKLGGCLRFSRDSIEAWIEKGCPSVNCPDS